MSDKTTVHEIRSIEDLMKVVTEENVDMLMGNFYGIVKCFLKEKKKNPRMELLGFDWFDDGKIEIVSPQTFKIIAGLK